MDTKSQRFRLLAAAGVVGAAAIGYWLLSGGKDRGKGPKDPRNCRKDVKDPPKPQVQEPEESKAPVEESKVEPLPTRTAGGAGGLTLPVIGVGSWSFGGSKDDYWGEQVHSVVENIVTEALKSGLTYFDTATMYNNGESERALGIAIKKVDEKGHVIVGTKVYLPDDTASPDAVRQNCKDSLERLGMDSVDLYMVHWPIPSETVKPCFEALAELQKEGKIKHIGVSNFGVKQLTEALETGVKISINQLMYNLVSRGIELAIQPLCQKNDIGIIAYSPLMQGMLTGKYDSIDSMPVMRTRTRHFNGAREKSRHGGPGCEKEIWEAVTEVKKIAEEIHLPMSELAIAWCLANPAVTCVIPGARNVDQLGHNYAAGRLYLGQDIVDRLNKATDPVLEKLGDKVDYYEGDENQRTF